jgi:hypothetical protein
MECPTKSKRRGRRFKFWLLRVLKTVVGGFLTGLLISFATMFLRDMGLLDPEAQMGTYALLTVAAWIGWLIYMVMPLFRRRRPVASA